MNNLTRIDLGSLKVNGSTYRVEKVTNGVDQNTFLIGPRGGRYYLSLFERPMWGVYSLATGRPLTNHKGEHVHVDAKGSSVDQMRVTYL